MLPVTVRLSAWSDGVLMREPTLLTDVGLREALLTATDYDEERVNFICRSVTENGQCRLMGADDGSEFMLEKILQS